MSTIVVVCSNWMYPWATCVLCVHLAVCLVKGGMKIVINPIQSIKGKTRPLRDPLKFTPSQTSWLSAIPSLPFAGTKKKGRREEKGPDHKRKKSSLSLFFLLFSPSPPHPNTPPFLFPPHFIHNQQWALPRLSSPPETERTSPSKATPSPCTVSPLSYSLLLHCPRFLLSKHCYRSSKRASYSQRSCSLFLPISSVAPFLLWGLS